MLICYNNVVSLGHNIQVVCQDKLVKQMALVSIMIDQSPP